MLRYIGLALIFCCSLVWADGRSQLQHKLAAMQAYEADFKQVVTDTNGQVLSKSEGSLHLKRPRSFLIKTQSPELSYLYTKEDGIYFYDSFLEQVNIYDKGQLDNQPFALLYSNDKALWNKYSYQQKGAKFIIKSKSTSDIFKQLELSFTGKILQHIKIRMRDGNINDYSLYNAKLKVNDQVFDIKLPAEVEINDERV